MRFLSKPPVPAQPQTEETQPDTKALALAQIDAILARDYATVAEGECELTRKIKQLADENKRRAQIQLTSNVNLSIANNATVISVAKSARTMAQLNEISHQLATAMEQMTVSIDEISGRTHHTSEETTALQHIASTARTDSADAIEAVDTIATAVTHGAEKLQNLADASAQIGEVVGLIGNIASQTNLLALNATVEAARAGEAGKGFAVVASEVKNLANQTEHATKDINERIERLRDEMDSIARTMRQGVEAVERGQKVITNTLNSMGEIDQGVSRVNTDMNDIAAVLNQQKSVTQDITHRTEDIATMTDQTVQANEEVLNEMDQTEGLITDQMDRLMRHNLATRDLIRAKADHMIWRKRLADMILGRTVLDPDELSSHKHCRLGKWYTGPLSDTIKSHPAFIALDPPHAKVHELGIQAARAFAEHDLDKAIVLIEEIEAPSLEVQGLLDDLIAYVAEQE